MAVKRSYLKVHLSPPKRIKRDHFEVMILNEMHQFDLLYMPSDTLYKNKYKYILSGIDDASRYKVVRPMRTKQVKDVANRIAYIYNVGHLTFPKIFQCNNGSEFKAEATKLLEKHEITIRHATMKYKHTHTAFVEALNKLLTEQLFWVQDAQEMNDPKIVSSAWVKHLYRLVDKLNDTEMQIIGMTPKDAIKLKEVPLANRENYPTEYMLPEDGLYRYLLQPGEKHDNQSKKTMDNMWSKKTYRLREIVEDSGNSMMYYLKDGPERAFVAEKLMLIPEDTGVATGLCSEVVISIPIG